MLLSIISQVRLQAVYRLKAIKGPNQPAVRSIHIDLGQGNVIKSTIQKTGTIQTNFYGRTGFYLCIILKAFQVWTHYWGCHQQDLGFLEQGNVFNNVYSHILTMFAGWIEHHDQQIARTIKGIGGVHGFTRVNCPDWRHWGMDHFIINDRIAL